MHQAPVAAVSAAPTEGTRLLRTLAAFRAASGSDVAFGGPVTRDGAALEITGLHSTDTRSLQGLRVRSRQGLGGQALALGRPVTVVDYQNARGITHHYDEPVRAERLHTVSALPIVVDRVPRMVLYLAHRAEVALGEVWFDTLLPLVRRLERDIAVDDEVRRRVDALRPSQPSPADVEEATEELDLLLATVDDDALRARLERIRRRLAPGAETPPARPAADAPRLAAREVDVLAQVALGRTNREVAEALGLVESTVKSYLKTAARKLGASNRVHAVRLAREAGLIV